MLFYFNFKSRLDLKLNSLFFSFRMIVNNCYSCLSGDLFNCVLGLIYIFRGAGCGEFDSLK